MRPILLYLIMLYCLEPTHAQKYDYTWRMGQNIVIPADSLMGDVVINFSTVDGNPEYSYSTQYKSGFNNFTSMICDRQGQFALSYDGFKLEDNRHNLVAGSEELCDREFCAYDPQSSLFLPSSDNDSIYYLINGVPLTIGDSFVLGFVFKDLRVTTILQTEERTVILGQEIIVMDSLDLGRLTACRHANGRDWWIVTGRFLKDEIYSILLSDGKVKSIVSSQTDRFRDFGNRGYAAFSHEGRFYCSTSKDKDLIKGKARFEFYHFDRCTGHLTDRQGFLLDSVESFSTSCAFSPGDQYLYISTSQWLERFKIISGKLEQREKIAIYDGYVGHLFGNSNTQTFLGPMQSGPDGRIYMNPDQRQSRYLHVIENPNEKDPSLVFIPRKKFLNAVYIRKPTFPNYLLGPEDGSLCDSLGIDSHPWSWWRYEQDTVRKSCIRFMDLSRNATSGIQWDFGDGTQSSESNPIHCFSSGGLYKVCLTVRNEQDAVSLCRYINMILSGENHVIDQQIKFTYYPNPIQSELIVHVKDYISDGLRIEVSNATGKILIQRRIFQGQNFFDWDTLPEGIYFIKVYEGRRLIDSHKLIKI